MVLPKGENPVAVAIAEALLDGFDTHYRVFRETSRAAKARFESGDWLGQQRAVRDRIAFYDQRVRETAGRLHAEALDENTWAQAKLLYIGLLTNHKQPELAETFFSSVFCRIMDRNYFHNEFIFFRPAVSTEYIESDPPAYRTYYPLRHGWQETLRRICADLDWRCPFADLDRDVGYVLEAARQASGGELRAEPNCQIHVLASAFYRNKAAYVCGKLVNGDREYPFVVPGSMTGTGGSISTPCSSTRSTSGACSASTAPISRSTSRCPGVRAVLRTLMPCCRVPSCTRCSASETGQDDVLPRARAPSAALRRRVHRRTGRARAGDGGVHAPLVPLRLQGDPRRDRAAEGDGPRNRQGEVPAGEAARPGRAHGRHP
jgi:hypothetical protein